MFRATITCMLQVEATMGQDLALRILVTEAEGGALTPAV